MKLLNRLTIKNLKLNKSRTIVTIVGIVLAIGLIAAVVTLVSTIQASILEYTKNTFGNYHYEFINVQPQDLEKIIKNENIESVFVTQNQGDSILSTESLYYITITEIENYANENNLNVYVRFKDLKTRLETAAQILEIDEETFNKLKTNNRSRTEENLYRNETNKYMFRINNELIQLEIGDFTDQTLVMLYAVAMVIIIIIIITSIYCIGNSFNISITERIKQYGMLSSIGATSKQIKKAVLYEAFILGVIAIPIGIVLGIGSIFIVLKGIEKILNGNLFGMEFIFSTNFIAILITVLLSILTIYLSAKKSAKKASKITAIEAIRSNKDINISSKELKTPKIIKKLFGIGGDIAYKNIKRNKKKYKATVISIIISVSVFIAMMSFSNYAFKVSEIYYDKYNYNLFLIGNDYEKIKEISEDPNIEIFSLPRRANTINIKDIESHRSQEIIELGHNLNSISVVCVGEGEYIRYINELGLKYEDCKNKAILMDYKTELVDIDGKEKYKIFRTTNYQEGDIVQLENIYQEFDYNEEDNSTTLSKEEKKTIDIEIAIVTDKKPMELAEGPSAYLIVSDEFMDENQLETSAHELFIDAENDIELEQYIKEKYPTYYDSISNMDTQEREQKTMLLTIAIFIYTFILVTSLIGVTNIFNTITTNMELRQKEFANLKSIGMTKKEFNRMIRLESLLYGIKSLIIGVPIGIGLSYLIYKGFTQNVEMEYMLPVRGIVIAIFAVFLLIGLIMKYSLNKINKQNIIETIRNENI